MVSGLEEDGDSKLDPGRSSMNISRSVAWPRGEHTSPELRKEVRPSHQVLASLMGAQVKPRETGMTGRDVVRVAVQAAVRGPGVQVALPQRLLSNVS